MEIENLNEGQPVDTSTEVNTAPEENNASTGESKETAEQTSETLYAGKYKSVEDLEKGYRESTKYARELGAKVKGLEDSIPKAPENYEFDFSNVEGLEGVQITPEDEDIAAMIPVFKELNLNQDQASKLVSAHLKNMASLAETDDQIKEKLGDNADFIIGKLQEYTNGLPESDQMILQSLADSSAGIDFLFRHLIGQGEMPTPGVQNNVGSSQKTAAQLEAEAFEFRKNNAASIGFNATQQKQYNDMMRAAVIARQNEMRK